MAGADWDTRSYTNADGEEVPATECVTGDYQSPIDLPTSQSSTNGGRLQGSYYNKIMSTNAEVSNIVTGTQSEKHTYSKDIQYLYQSFNLTHNTHYHTVESYTSNNLRFVTPSEHLIDGEAFAMELQILGPNAAEDTGSSTRHAYMIYSVLFEVSEEAPATVEAANALGADDQNRWGALLFGQNYMTVATNKVASVMAEGASTGEIPIGDFLKESIKEEYWNYDGSLTRIPCSEYADVMVSKTTYKIHADVVALYSSIYQTVEWRGDAEDVTQGNNRGVQEFKGRRLIFIQDISATTLAATFAGLATLAASFF